MSLHLNTMSEYELQTAIQYQTMSGSTKTSFETMVQEFCSMHNRMEERPFEITTEMIFNDSYHVHVVIARFVSHIKKNGGVVHRGRMSEHMWGGGCGIYHC